MVVLRRKGYRIVFLITFLFSIYTATIIFLYFQSKKINRFLSDDFRVVVSLLDKAPQDILSRISSIRGVKSYKKVLSSELMSQLEKEDRDLYLSVKSLAKNPIPDIVEVEVDPLYLWGIDSIVDEISKIPGVGEIRYRPDEIAAIIHTEFYSRFLLFVFGMGFVVIFLMILFSIIHVGFSGFFSSVIESSKWFLNGLAGSLLGVVFVYIILMPIKNITPLWSWFDWYYSFAVIISGGFIGWVFYQWKRD